MKKLFRVALAALTLLPTTAHAQSKSEVAEECLSALQAGDNSRATEIAEEIKTWRALFATKLKSDARKCLDGVTGEPWVYNVAIGQFISRRAASEARNQEAAKKEELLDRKCELRSEVAALRSTISSGERLIENTAATIKREATLETVRQCQIWFEEDSRGAVTNAVCNELFQVVGLPNSPDFEISLAKRSEIEGAKSRLLLAERELDIILEHNMLPLDYYNKVIESLALAAEVRADECANRDN